ncbi:MAG: transporter substrate-binding domain-containing protein [Myxococcales bacterium]|nr:transporter substrate-binding domain-containing protein [Myxococcales bacterium]
MYERSDPTIRGLYVAPWACAAVLLGLGAPARADDLADLKARKQLQWGGDQEGGGPYIYPREDKPDEVTGFEVDMAAKLATYLGVESVFIQSQWDRLPDMLRTHKVDVVLNGFELSAARTAVMDATMPYFVYGLQLLCHKDDARCAAWDDLKLPRDGNKPRIGVLTGSAAEDTARAFCGEACEVITYDGGTDTMREVETGKLDACVQDTPIWRFYATRFPALKAVAAPVGKGYYVMFVRKGEAKFVQALNEAIVMMLKNGDLERMYRKYGIWDDLQGELAGIVANARFFGLENAWAAVEAAAPAPAARTDAAATAGAAAGTPTDAALLGGAATATTGPPPSGAASSTPPAMPASTMPTQAEVVVGGKIGGWEVVRKYGAILTQSAGMTVVLAALSFPLAILLGMLVAVGRLYGPLWLRPILTIYVEFLRGTPVMLQLYFIFFFLPEIGIAVPAFWTGVLGLAINYSAYESEIYRAGLQAIPPGQMEAALSLGMSRATALRHIIVPQAFRIVIPPVVNDFIALFKDTSVCSVVTIVELTKRFSVLSMSTQATVELMVITAVLYLLMSYPMSVVARHIEKKLGVATFA